MKKTVQPLILDLKNQELENPSPLRILFLEKETRLDFGYLGFKNQSNLSWINISPKTVLINLNNEKKYKLLRTESMPMAPDKMFFPSKDVFHFFSLYFESVPLEDQVLELFECDDPDNFFTIKRIEVIISEGLPFSLSDL